MRLVDVAAHFRTWPSTVSRWESGKARVPDEHKFRLARLLGTSVPHMMGWDGDTTTDEPESTA